MIWLRLTQRLPEKVDVGRVSLAGGADVGVGKAAEVDKVDVPVDRRWGSEAAHLPDKGFLRTMGAQSSGAYSSSFSLMTIDNLEKNSPLTF